MIAKAIRGASARGLARYLHGAGRRNEHVYKQRGKTFAGGVVIGGSVDVERTESGEWGKVLDRVIGQRENVKRGVYHLPIRADPGDRTLSDGEWRVIAERVLGALDIGNDHPWVVVRHADDHVHIALSRVSFDGTKVAKMSWDYRAIMQELRAVEQDHGLTSVPMPGQNVGRDSVHERVTTADASRAMRTGEAPPRTRTAALVRAARDASAGLGRDEFERQLDAFGVEYRANVASTGRVSGYSFAAGVDADGTTVWLAASKVSRELAWSKLSATLNTGAAVDLDHARTTAHTEIESAAGIWQSAGEKAQSMKKEARQSVGRDVAEVAATTVTDPVAGAALGALTIADRLTNSEPGIVEMATKNLFANKTGTEQQGPDRELEKGPENGRTDDAPGWIDSLRASQHAARERIAGHAIEREDDGLSR